MADTKISALTEATSLTGAEDIPVLQSATTKRVGVDTLFSTANSKWSGWYYPYTTGWVGTAGQPLTSTAWDGDAYSTTAKTLIDLSVVFGVPAGAKAVLVRLIARDSGSAAGTGLYFGVDAGSGSFHAVAAWPAGRANDTHDENSGICPCDANGDIYYQTVASGAGTLDCWLYIFGYCL